MFLVLVGVYGLTATYRYPASTDVVNTVLPAYRLGVDGSVDLTPYAPYIESRRVVQEQFVRVDGEWRSGRNPGVIAVAVPFYAAFRPSVEPGTLPPLWPATVAAVLVCAGAMALLLPVLRHVLTERQALAGVGTAALGTTVWSTAADMLWTHGPSVLLLLAVLLALARGRDGWAGAAMGGAMLMRPELAVSAAVLGVGLAAGSRSWRRLGGLAAGPLVAAVALIAYFTIVLDTFSPVAGHQNTIMLADSPSLSPLRIGSDVVSVLTASRNGLLLYSPFLVLLVLGIHKAWRAAPTWTRLAAVAGVAHLLLIVTIQGNGDGNFLFGYRFPLEMLALSAPLLATSWREHVLPDAVMRRAFVALVAMSVAVHGAGAILEIRRGVP